MTDGVNVAGVSDRPEVVCSCGSTRFKVRVPVRAGTPHDGGEIFLTVGMFGHSDDVELSADEKAMLDALQKGKFDLADCFHVIDVGGYIGDSIQSEIDHVERHGIPVTYYSERTRDADTDQNGGRR